MRLGRRPKRKQDQALDLLASAAATWSQWQLAKRAGSGLKKGAKKASELKDGKSSGLKAAVTGTPARITGAIAVAGGLGAVIVRKLKGGGSAEPAYVPPAPHEPAAAPPPPPPVPVPPAPDAAAHKPPPLAAAPPPPPPEPDPAPEPEPEPEPEPTVVADLPEPEAAEPEEPKAEQEADDDADATDDDAADDDAAGDDDGGAEDEKKSS